MRVRHPHPWPDSPAEAVALQRRLAPRVVSEGEPHDVRFVAGSDLAFLDRGRKVAHARPDGRPYGRAAVVLLSYPALQVVERHVVEARVSFPYVPGLLSFRESPVLLQAFERLSRAPDLLLIDGHGYAHPRRFGIACHLGLLLDVPTIGCAKSRLVGEHDEPARPAGSRVDLRHEGERIGVVVRSRDGGRPLYVSPGHRLGFKPATDWVLRLLLPGARYRLPEPTRLADRLAAGLPL